MSINYPTATCVSLAPAVLSRRIQAVDSKLKVNVLFDIGLPEMILSTMSFPRSAAPYLDAGGSVHAWLRFKTHLAYRAKVRYSLF
jgi:hypothetical protein